MVKYVKKIYGQLLFKKTYKTFYFALYLFITNKIKYISDISVGTAVRASSSFPGIFCPCEYKNHKFLDGGILDNIPVKEVRKQGADKVIAVNFKADIIDENSNFMDISMRTLDIMGNKISEE